MADAASIRRLQRDDLADYKALRDAVLAEAPTAFISDAAEERPRSAPSYLPRLGLDRPEGGHFTLGAWHGDALVGAISVERETRIKGRHIAHVVGMMVRAQSSGQGIGRALLAACIALARPAEGLELLTLSVTATNSTAVGLYCDAGFVRYGTLVHAIKQGGRYHDKDLMVLSL